MLVQGPMLIRVLVERVTVEVQEVHAVEIPPYVQVALALVRI